eukprot:TRINITY_DN2269_c0_g2_i1.p1 TRINITY_DN2269_c0_g2~~TRINITY_DN2269_c0_g2_i1.p1  ORF type:complete len:212 (-),score=44.08 TRINITY_DN2269_c0_g2_i1:44-679(-)
MNKRRNTDVSKLLMSDYKVELQDHNINEFLVTFNGPKDSAYEGGTWKIRVGIPSNYPYKSPSIGFVNRIYHPNVDEGSGSVCLDVINQTWSPMFDLVNIFEVFLPQLLLYPNPKDPLNREAASILIKDSKRFHQIVKDHVKKHAMNIIPSSPCGNSTSSPPTTGTTPTHSCLPSDQNTKLDDDDDEKDGNLSDVSDLSSLEEEDDGGIFDE